MPDRSERKLATVPSRSHLRALGIVQDDDDLVARADSLFRELQLDWHADQTDTLRRFRELLAG